MLQYSKQRLSIIGADKLNLKGLLQRFTLSFQLLHGILYPAQLLSKALQNVVLNEFKGHFEESCQKETKPPIRILKKFHKLMFIYKTPSRKLSKVCQILWQEKLLFEMFLSVSKIKPTTAT